MIKVAIIDDHSVMRLGIRFVMKTDPELAFVAEADGCESGLKMIAANAPDVVLLDIRMTGEDGVATLDKISRRFPSVNVIMLTSFSYQEEIYQSIKGGAKGYLLKDAEPAVIVEAVKTVAAGGTYFPEEIQRQYRERCEYGGLTGREREVLTLVTKGLSNPEIGKLLSISVDGVKSHLRHIYTKLGCADRAEAVSLALSRGILKE